MSSRRLKFASAALGALVGSLAWMKAFSFSDSQDAVEGTKRLLANGHIRRHRRRELIQSGGKKKVKIPRRTVNIPSVRMSLRVNPC
jgi:hypothetical protein